MAGDDPQTTLQQPAFLYERGSDRQVAAARRVQSRALSDLLLRSAPVDALAARSELLALRGAVPQQLLDDVVQKLAESQLPALSTTHRVVVICLSLFVCLLSNTPPSQFTDPSAFTSTSLFASSFFLYSSSAALLASFTASRTFCSSSAAFF